MNSTFYKFQKILNAFLSNHIHIHFSLKIKHSKHGRSQDFFRGEHFFKKFSKNLQKYAKNYIKNFQKIFKNIQKNYKKFVKKIAKMDF